MANTTVLQILGVIITAEDEIPAWAGELIQDQLLPPYSVIRTMPEPQLKSIRDAVADVLIDEQKLPHLRDVLLIAAWAFGYGPGANHG